MTFGKPVRRSSLISQVTEQLRDEICSGRWAVGAKIPTETALSELTGTGRNTVREAVQALVHTGLLERRQGSGTYVVATSDVGGTLGKYFAGAHERDVTELRQALDVTAAALAARRRTPDDVARLQSLLDERSRCWAESDTEAAVAADVSLHRAIVEASHNAVYLEFYDSLLPSIAQTVDRHVHATGVGFHDEHGRLIQAVVDGDEAAATTAARDLFAELLT
ncbi:MULTISPECIES: FadR/GntR family transcriptional regulator [Rhodococcus]|jgi:DNA-binding FadR family transcriptional regulator|uniref:FCD domain-containing protein n=1 Tax=Rhodococcus jostii TaxID=132919 RepID=A0ABU4CFJ6_RHOJO|nr:MULTISPECIES: FCD domain-containing protein [Rhodococcus]MDH6288910.1 DNA-binding FadR family transcriptional regulator [Rhodococcus opacus]MDI9952530.1 FCD domain-containing protein [Rhodococcus sp. IEGM 1305]MDI9978437.1 FCD domain-containing protein [Rhodococcus sp. IEGM 1307]MDV6282321.1 FCD domain-containing protein [Rhodococcus jostii]